MGFWDALMGRTINPQSGQYVRTRRVGADDWGNTYLIVEEKTPGGEWQKTSDVPNSTTRTGGHYE